MPRDIKRIHEMIRGGDLGQDTLNMLAELSAAEFSDEPDTSDEPDSSVMPDWKENDPESEHYIANRPGGYFEVANTYETSGRAKLDDSGRLYIDIAAPDWVLDGGKYYPSLTKIEFDHMQYDTLYDRTKGNGTVFALGDPLITPNPPSFEIDPVYTAVPFALYSSNDTTFTKMFVKEPGVHRIKITKLRVVSISVGTIASGAKDGSTLGIQATAEGMGTVASGTASHAEGSDTTASGEFSHAEGGGSYASGEGSHAEGTGRAYASRAHAEGQSTNASGPGSHSEGSGTNASGDYAHSEGGGTTASGASSHSEGSGTQATGAASHAEGGGSRAGGNSAHAEGQGTNASGNGAHAEGGGTQSTGNTAHAEGTGSIASGDNSHAEGAYTIAAGKYQHVGGTYNIADTPNGETGYSYSAGLGTYVEIIGNGTREDEKSGDVVTVQHRSNARTLDWNGNEWLAGTLKLGGTSADDNAAVDVLAAINSLSGAGGGSAADDRVDKLALALAARDIITYDQFEGLTGKQMQDIDLTWEDWNANGEVDHNDGDVYYTYGRSEQNNVRLRDLQAVNGVLTLPQFVIMNQDDSVVYRVKSLVADYVVPNNTTVIVPYGYETIGSSDADQFIDNGVATAILPDSIKYIETNFSCRIGSDVYLKNLKKISHWGYLHPLPDTNGNASIYLPGGVDLEFGSFSFTDNTNSVSIYFKGIPKSIAGQTGQSRTGEGAFETYWRSTNLTLNVYVPWQNEDEYSNQFDAAIKYHDNNITVNMHYGYIS